jgi:hypothetical protein
MTECAHTRLFHDPETPRELIPSILARIECARRRAARFRLAALGVVIAVSGTALVPAANYTLHEFYTSGFYDYLTLFFSDSQIAFAHWQEISFSLAESLPSIALLVLVSVAAVFLWSLRSARRDMKIVFRMRTA